MENFIWLSLTSRCVLSTTILINKQAPLIAVLTIWGQGNTANNEGNITNLSLECQFWFLRTVISQELNPTNFEEWMHNENLMTDAVTFPAGCGWSGLLSLSDWIAPCNVNCLRALWTASWGGGSKKSKVETFLIPMESIWRKMSATI